LSWRVTQVTNTPYERTLEKKKNPREMEQNWKTSVVHDMFGLVVLMRIYVGENETSDFSTRKKASETDPRA